jgi:hypothetical protein
MVDRLADLLSVEDAIRCAASRAIPECCQSVATIDHPFVSALHGWTDADVLAGGDNYNLGCAIEQ